MLGIERTYTHTLFLYMYSMEKSVVFDYIYMYMCTCRSYTCTCMYMYIVYTCTSGVVTLDFCRVCILAIGCVCVLAFDWMGGARNVVGLPTNHSIN